MIERMLWFERKFDTDLPAHLFPGAVERLRGTPARLEERVRDLTQEQLTRQPGGSWSIQENAGHLADLEPLWLGRLDDFDAGADTLRPADLENTKTHAAGHNAAAIGDLLAAFRRERAGIVRRLDAMDAAAVGRTAKHPRLGTPMTVLELAFFMAEHDDHHMARITELLAADPPPPPGAGGVR
jgi:uncharacterized damage-inducible protein DinB